MSPSEEAPHVAIIGGGLCGLALAIALTKRSIPYTVYEARSSFSEIGAGISLAPNSMRALNFIDASLEASVYALATRNPPGHEADWLTVRLGAPTHRFVDTAHILDISAPPTGNMAVGRNEFLQLLAKQIRPGTARFNKKLVGLQQAGEDGVRLAFDDGTVAHAGLVVGCDGIHSAVRRAMLSDGGAESPAAVAKYSDMGCYRAVFPMEVHERAVGKDIAHSGNIWAGPQGYIIMYPIDGGRNVNIGVWTWKREPWTHPAWVVEGQKGQMLEDMKAWGPAAHRIFEMIREDVSFWAGHHHSVQPQSCFKGRVVVIGDASHSMGPHTGQGAAQSMEDAAIMGAVLEQILVSPDCSVPLSSQIEAAFTAYEAVRKPRFEQALWASYEMFSFWSDFWRPDLDEQDLEKFRNDVYERLTWLWKGDIAGQADEAKKAMMRHLDLNRQET